jgi:hypothetical protein
VRRNVGVSRPRKRRNVRVQVPSREWLELKVA